MTPGDIARIERATGSSRSAFLVSREVDAVEQQAWEEDDPATRGLVREGRVFSLARGQDDCVFLGAQGCTLGDARPLLCHRFPLVRIGSRVEVKPGGVCLAVEEADDLPGLLIALGTSRKKLRQLDRQLAAELREATRVQVIHPGGQ